MNAPTISNFHPSQMTAATARRDNMYGRHQLLQGGNRARPCNLFLVYQIWTYFLLLFIFHHPQQTHWWRWIELELRHETERKLTMNVRSSWDPWNPSSRHEKEDSAYKAHIVGSSWVIHVQDLGKWCLIAVPKAELINCHYACSSSNNVVHNVEGLLVQHKH